MASLISVSGYDNFITSLQEDYKCKNLETEFVNAGKWKSLYALKEGINGYFDISNHDGLMGIHDVGTSIRYKIKGLILIPVTSNTFFDPRVFVGGPELIAFIQNVSTDQPGV